MRVLLILLMALFMASPALAKPSFDAWLKNFKQKAAKEGISESTLTIALANLTPNEKVIDLDRNQPGSKWTFVKYKEKIVHPDRIRKGRELYKKHYKTLKATEAKYGVPAEVIVAL